jgi:hypothetical protein
MGNCAFQDNSPEIEKTIQSLVEGQTTILKLLEKIMATSASILAAQAQEDSDLAVLVGLVKTLVSNAASGNVLTPAQAQQILADMGTQDTTITGLSASINAALNPPAAPTS